MPITIRLKTHTMRALLLLFTISIFVSCQTKQTNTQENSSSKYEPTWESLAKHEAAPEWFVDSKLGIYFHWGVYSVPPFANAWYPRAMYEDGSKVQQYHEKNYGKIGEFDYHDFISMFKAEHFDAEDWAELFQSSGAKFAGPVAQHHDGFAMWNSEVNPWNAADMGPQKDILGELFKSLEKRNMKTIATFHHARLGQRNAKIEANWKIGYNSHYPYHPNYVTSTTDPKLRKLYGNFETIDEFNAYWRDQVNEVVDKYNPDIIWFDSWLDRIPESNRKEMAAHHFNNGLKNNKEVVICHKQHDMPMECSVLDFEQGGRRETHPMPWMTDITLGNSRWKYVDGQTYKEPAMVIRNMIDVWSKNGTVLLNVSPQSNGIINQEQRDVLKEIGDWLKIHGEAVYETRPYLLFGYGTAHAPAGSHGGQSAKTEYTKDDVRFTWSKDKKSMYAFFLGKPAPGQRVKMHQLCVHRYGPPTSVKRVTVLGTNAEAKWEPNTQTCYLTFPEIEMNELATVVKFELE